ncbi:hypothetical protein KJ877_01000 [bacterium]|nr:hypothetical protein [bacterium]MBU1989839.1 hypothetical protein [bacterium]
MKNFEPEKIKSASKYLTDKLQNLKKPHNDSFVIEKKKIPNLRRFINLLFKS